MIRGARLVEALLERPEGERCQLERHANSVTRSVVGAGAGEALTETQAYGSEQVAIHAMAREIATDLTGPYRPVRISAPGLQVGKGGIEIFAIVLDERKYLSRWPSIKFCRRLPTTCLVLMGYQALATEMRQEVLGEAYATRNVRFFNPYAELRFEALLQSEGIDDPLRLLPLDRRLFHSTRHQPRWL